MKFLVIKKKKNAFKGFFFSNYSNVLMKAPRYFLD